MCPRRKRTDESSQLLQLKNKTIAVTVDAAHLQNVSPLRQINNCSTTVSFSRTHQTHK